VQAGKHAFCPAWPLQVQFFLVSYAHSAPALRAHPHVQLSLHFLTSQTLLQVPDPVSPGLHGPWLAQVPGVQDPHWQLGRQTRVGVWVPHLGHDVGVPCWIASGLHAQPVPASMPDPDPVSLTPSVAGT
jgi:hypothetical protein